MLSPATHLVKNHESQFKKQGVVIIENAWVFM